jgi:hypothetical protein
MDTTEIITVNTRETEFPEIDSAKALLNCPNQTSNGIESSCKCGAFLVPLCIVI